MLKLKNWLFIIILLLLVSKSEAAVTFDVATNLSDMVFYDASAGTYTARNITTGDYFDNDSAVDDYIAFGWDRGAWHTLTVNVGTQLVADSITVVWEYMSATATWTALADVTDNTNAFQNAGSNTVVFTVPDSWYYKANLGAITTADGHFIRARITAVTNISEGGANATDIIQGGDWAIQINDADTRLSDIQTADDNGAWGMTTTNGKETTIIANLRILNGGELYIRNGEFFQVGLTTKRRIILMNSGAFFQMGILDVNGDYNEGANLYYWVGGNPDPYNYWYGTFNMYNSHFTKSGGSYNDPGIQCVVDIDNSIIDVGTSSTVYFAPNSSGSMKNLTVDFRGSRFYLYSSNMALDNLILADTIGIIGGYNNVLTNVDFGTDKTVLVYQPDLYMLNCKFDDYSAQISSYGGTNVGYVQYTVSLTIIDEDGVAIDSPNVVLTNAEGTDVFSGIWSADFTATAWKEDTFIETDYNPFTITVSKAGYRVYTGVITIDKKTDFDIILDKGDTVIYDSTLYDCTIY